MAVVEPADLPVLDLDRLRRLRSLDSLAEAEMRSAQRACLLDGGARDPSVETLLHAFLPHKFMAHCHANAALSVTNQPDGEALSAALCAKLTPCRALSSHNAQPRPSKARPTVSDWY